MSRLVAARRRPFLNPGRGLVKVRYFKLSPRGASPRPLSSSHRRLLARSDRITENTVPRIRRLTARCTAKAPKGALSSIVMIVPTLPVALDDRCEHRISESLENGRSGPGVP